MGGGNGCRVIFESHPVNANFDSLGQSCVDLRITPSFGSTLKIKISAQWSHKNVVGGYCVRLAITSKKESNRHKLCESDRILIGVYRS